MYTIPDDIKLLLDLTIGDGYLGIKNNSEYPVFRCEHSIKQKEYADYKNKLLIENGYKTNYRIYTSNNPKQLGKEYCRIDIYSDSRLKTARKYLYNEKIKTIDKKLLNQLDDRSLSFLFMDDGSVKTVEYILKPEVKIVYKQRKAHSYKIATNCFSLEENKLFSNWLKNEFSINSTISKSPSNFGYYIYIAQIESKDIFKNLVEPYMIDCMKYKISYPHSFTGIDYDIIPRFQRREETE